VDSPPFEPQVTGYLDCLRRHYRENCAVAFISRLDPDFESDDLKDRCFTWRQVYETIAEEQTSAHSPLVKALLRYMESNDMGHLHNISHIDTPKILCAVFAVVDEAARIVGNDWSKRHQPVIDPKLGKPCYANVYYGRTLRTVDKKEWLALSMCWLDSKTLTWAIQLLPPSPPSPPSPQYENAKEPKWKQGWYGWYGATLAIDVFKKNPEFADLSGEEQAKWLAASTIEEIEALQRQQ
jgi:hypothetical protein